MERATEMQNHLNNLVQGLNHELSKDNFFLDNNVDSSQQQQQQQHFIPKEAIRRCSSRRQKRYNITQVKSQNVLTNISYNALKRIDFDKA